MTNAPGGQSTSPDWKQLLHLSEELLNQPTAADQCHLIARTVENLLGGKANVWLARPFYPLPGEPDVNILPSPSSPELVRKTYDDRQPCCQSRHGISLAECCMDEHPRRVAVPLITRGAMLGILQAERKNGDGFTAADLEALEGLAAYSALTLQISRQVSIKNWRNSQLALVRSVSAQIANILNLDELCQRVVALIQKTFNYYYVAIFTLEENQSLPNYRACASMNGEAPSFSVGPGEGIIGQVTATGIEILAADVRDEPRYRLIDSLPETRSEFTLPLKVENHVLGVLDVQSDQLDAFHEIDVQVLRTLADNIALAVEGARLYTTVKRRADQISAVFEVSHALASILDTDRLLKEVVQVIQRRFGYPYVHLFTVHPGRRKIFFRAGSGERSQVYAEREVTYDLDTPAGIIPWVARNKKTLLANDVSKEEHYRPSDLPPYETNSELAIPLQFGDEVLGVLDIQSDAPNAFDENDSTLLESLAASTAIAMRNASLYSAEKWRRQVADSFRDVAGMLSTNIALNELLDQILIALEANLPCEASAIWLIEEPSGKQDKPSLQLAASHGVTSDQLIQARQRSARVSSWLDQAMDNPYPTIRTPNDPYGPLGAALDLPLDYSSIACPLRSGEKTLGVLTLAHHTTGRYGSEARDLTATFASYAAVAIQDARLYQESQEQAWISTVLLQVAESNQAVSNLEELLSNTIRLLALLLGVRKAAIFLRNENQASFTLNEVYGMSDPKKGAVFSETSTPALSRLLTTRSAFPIHKPEKELNLPDAAILDANGVLMMLPLVARGEVLGALMVAYQDSLKAANPRQMGDQMFAILQGIAHQMAIAMENIRLVDARQEEAYVTAVLLQVAQAVVSQNNLDDILETIVHLMPILVGISACAIYLWDRARQAFVPAQAFSSIHPVQQDLLSHIYMEGEFSILDQVHESDAAVFCPLGRADQPPADWPSIPCLPPGVLPDASGPAQSSWLIGVPLSVKGEKYGVLLAEESGAQPGSRERQLEILNGVSQEVALAIQNERLQQERVINERTEREIQLAREIQRTFLPNRLPQPTGWEIDAYWQTARQVGGDFYDIFRTGDKKLGVVIADVADKGMPAALYMTVTRTLIRSSIHHIHSPARVLERVNNLLVPDALNGMFVTAVYAVLNPETGELTYANAGHNRPLLLRGRSGQIETLPKGGIALGVLENSDLREETFWLEPDDCLILYTDGVTDTFGPNQETFGLERLHTVLSASAGQGARQVIDIIDHALEEFRQGEPLGDDVTLLVMHRKKK